MYGTGHIALKFIQCVIFTILFSKVVDGNTDCSTKSGESRYMYEGGNEDQQHCVNERAIGIPDNERRILLIGKTGVGKSTTGNTILKNNTFHAAVSATSVTDKTRLGEATRFGRHLLVVDTPGFFDTKRSDEEIMIEIAKCYGITSPGLHAIVMVLGVGRYTEEEQKTMNMFYERFGENVSNFVVVVFTGKDRLEKDGKTITQFVNNLENNSSLRVFLRKIKDRFVAFDYGGNPQDRDKEVIDLLDMIDNMVRVNGGQYYTNEMYNEAERLFRQRLEEVERIEKEKYKEELERVKEKMERENMHTVNALMEEKKNLEESHRKQLFELGRQYEREKHEREEMIRREHRRNYESGKRGVLRSLVCIVSFGFYC